MAENSFSKINYFQRDGAYECTKGEFKAVLNYCGIISRISCPHTTEQNGLVTQAYNSNEIDSCLQASLLKKVRMDAFLLQYISSTGYHHLFYIRKCPMNCYIMAIMLNFSIICSEYLVANIFLTWYHIKGTSSLPSLFLVSS